MKIAIFGGSFNPIHYGHLIGAISVLDEINYDKIFFVPAGLVNHKDTSNYASSYHRYNMVKLAIENYSYFDISDYDIKKDGYSYTIDIVRHFYDNYKIEGKIGVIIGDDLIKNLLEWKDIFTLQEISDIICLGRKKTSVCDELKIKYLNNRIIEISSSEIIERIKKGKKIDFLLPEKVKDYIIKNGLYIEK